MARKYNKNVVEMTLQGVEGSGPWAPRGKASQHVVTATLIWPRPLVASRVAVQTHTFTSEGCQTAELDWSERILFKETVEGPFGVIVQVSESLSAQQLTAIAGRLGKVFFKAAASEAARVAVGPGLSALARFPFDYLADELSSLGKTPSVVAAGRITIMPGKEGTVAVPLLVPEPITRQRRITRSGRRQTRTETVHKQGESAGEALLSLAYYR
jgi:hypothetical protein